MFNGEIKKRVYEGLSSDARPRYKVEYEDGDWEELYAEEIVPLVQVSVFLVHACVGCLHHSTTPHTYIHLLLLVRRTKNENVSL